MLGLMTNLASLSDFSYPKATCSFKVISQIDLFFFIYSIKVKIPKTPLTRRSVTRTTLQCSLTSMLKQQSKFHWKGTMSPKDSLHFVAKIFNSTAISHFTVISRKWYKVWQEWKGELGNIVPLIYNSFIIELINDMKLRNYKVTK